MTHCWCKVVNLSLIYFECYRFCFMLCLYFRSHVKLFLPLFIISSHILYTSSVVSFLDHPHLSLLMHSIFIPFVLAHYYSSHPSLFMHPHLLEFLLVVVNLISLFLLDSFVPRWFVAVQRILIFLRQTSLMQYCILHPTEGKFHRNHWNWILKEWKMRRPFFKDL